jgi:hypothetical protein
MESEDVLERFEKQFAEDRFNARIIDIAEALAAEVRELRKDKARLCEYLMNRMELHWDDELLRIVGEFRRNQRGS